MRAVRGRAYLISVVLAGAVALPLVGLVQDDSFPVSTYPMFAARRTAEVTISHAVAVDVDGTRRAVSPGAVANLEVMQAFETVRQAVRQGPAATQRLCERIATRLAGDGARAARVEIVSERYDAVAYFEGHQEPLRRQRHASCEVAAR